MNAVRCPKCLYHEQSFEAPLGKVARNPYALGMWDDCNACEGTGYIPTKIVDAVVKAFPKEAEEIVSSLRWSSDHWSFVRWGMYIGIEPKDGYIHS